MNKKINQSDVKSIFDILKVVNNHSYALIPELAKELKVTKVELANYVLNNPKLFHTENIFSYREVKVKRMLWPNDPKSTYTTTENRRNRNLGMGVKEVYLSPIENYGYIEGYTIEIDKFDKDDKYRFYKWRNTEAKINWLKENGFTFATSFVLGGLGDSYSHKSENAISELKIKELHLLGWIHNDIPPLSR